MISLDALFWMYVILFGFIGMMRGWAKELLVSFSVILTLFLLTVLESWVPFIRDTLPRDGDTLFWLRTILLMVLVFFGYQSVNLPRLATSGRFARERLQDSLLGLFLGAVNGYLIFGSLWVFLDAAHYPLPFIQAPVPGTPVYEAASRLLPLLAPHMLGVPQIYFAIALAFAFVLVVFV